MANHDARDDAAGGTEDPLLQQVQRVMRERFERRDVSLPGLATAMGISSRTLQRALKQRDTSHQQLLDALRRERALELLDHEEKTVADVSAALGFREPSAFFRAFRRWTGTTPATRRKVKR